MIVKRVVLLVTLFALFYSTMSGLNLMQSIQVGAGIPWDQCVSLQRLRCHKCDWNKVSRGLCSRFYTSAALEALYSLLGLMILNSKKGNADQIMTHWVGANMFFVPALLSDHFGNVCADCNTNSDSFCGNFAVAVLDDDSVTDWIKTLQKTKLPETDPTDKFAKNVKSILT